VIVVGEATVGWVLGTAPLGLVASRGALIRAGPLDVPVSSARMGCRDGVAVVPAWAVTADVDNGRAAAKPDTGQIDSKANVEGRNGRSLRGVRMVFDPSRRKGSTGRSGDLICNDGFALGIGDGKCDGNQR